MTIYEILIKVFAKLEVVVGFNTKGEMGQF